MFVGIVVTTVLAMCVAGSAGNAVDHSVCPPPRCHWLAGRRVPEAGLLPGKISGAEVFCYFGTDLSQSDFLFSMWKRVLVEIETSDAPEQNFIMYHGRNYSDVLVAKRETDNVWFQWPWQDTQTSVPPYGVSCMGLTFRSRDIKYFVTVHTTPMYYRFPLLLAAGLLLFFFAPSLSQNIAFYYASSTTIGVLAFLLVLVFIVSRFVPHRKTMYVVLLGGWSLSAYFFRYVAENGRDIIVNHRMIIYGYLALSFVISAAYCYWKGPPSNPRSLKLLQMLLQVVALAMVYASSQSHLISAALVALTVSAFWIDLLVPQFLRNWLSMQWYIWFPVERKLLTEEEYAEQGRVETEKALADLRRYLQSPGASPWHVVRKLKDPTRFATFVEGESDVTEDETFLHERALVTSIDGLPEHDALHRDADDQ